MSDGLSSVHADTTQSTAIVRILRAFRAAQHVEEGKDVSLYFDGEELEPETLIGDAEVEDMDFIDVYVK